ncbi:MAG TPA: histidine phosphatase family protein [Streptosporangiaceae bacterium]|nr:histidine phosphatase family protein [Streptosporangiaceae bacterium]
MSGPPGPAHPAQAEPEAGGAAQADLSSRESEPAESGGPGWGRPLGKPTTTLLLRHGQTELSAERRFAGRGDIPLTKEGVRQAELAARRLAGVGATVVITSPLQRAHRTAEVVAEVAGVPLVVYEELIEADFGAWQGLTFGEAAKRWPDELEAWMTSPDATPPEGESFAMVAMRVLAGLDRLMADYPHQTTIVVSHVTPIKTLVCRALLAPPEAMFRMNLDVASLCQIDCFDNGSAVLRSLNDTAHLQQARRRWR